MSLEAWLRRLRSLGAGLRRLPRPPAASWPGLLASGWRGELGAGPWVGAHARRRPTDRALLDARRAWSWSELDQAITRAAHGLHRLGLRENQRLLIFSGNRGEALILQLAAVRVGATVAPLGAQVGEDDVADRCAAADWVALEGPRLEVALATRPGRVLTLPGSRDPRAVPWEELERAPRGPLPRPRGPAEMLLFTSGTTGRSKGAHLQPRAMGVELPLHLAELLDLGQGSLLWTSCPWYHAAPQLLLQLNLALGGAAAIFDRWPASPADLWNPLGVTHTFLVPPQVQKLLRLPPSEVDRLRRGPWRAALNSGAALHAPLKRAFHQLYGPILHDLYGATELGLVSHADPDDTAVREDTVGRPLPGVEVDLHPESGEITLRSRAPATAYEGAPPWSGPLRSGDAAIWREDRLVLRDRLRDLIVTGGVNVFPGDVERQLLALPGVRDAAVIGEPDPYWGEAVVAYVVLTEEVGAPPDLRAALGRRLAPAQIPKRIHLCRRLPRNPTGKLLRRALRPDADYIVGTASDSDSGSVAT